MQTSSDSMFRTVQFCFYFRSLWQMLRLDLPWSRSRVLRILFAITVFPVFELIQAMSLLLDNFLFPGYRRVQVREPVFIIGNARSGTTHLHRLMSLDTEHFNAFKMKEVILLAVVHKKWMRALYEWLERRHGNLLAALDRLQARLFGKFDRVHKLRLEEPEEDESVLVHCFASAYLGIILPVPGLDRWVRFDQLEDELRGRLMAFYKGCVQRQLYCYGGDRVRLLSKNPLFCFKVKSVVEAFPDARFLYLVRSPYEAVASVHRMYDHIWGSHMPVPKDHPMRAELTQRALDSYQETIDQIERWAPSRWKAIRYEDLVQSPQQTIESIYQWLGLPITDEFRQELVRVAGSSRAKESAGRYTLEQFGLSREQVYEACKNAFARFELDAETGKAVSNDPGLRSSSQSD